MFTGEGSSMDDYQCKLQLQDASDGEPRVIALVATRDRFDLLWSRCMESILAQTLLPQLIVLVDDSEEISGELDSGKLEEPYDCSIDGEYMHILGVLQQALLARSHGKYVPNPEVRGKNESMANLFNSRLGGRDGGGGEGSSSSSRPAAPPIVYLHNGETPGASGAWNTGIMFIAEAVACGAYFGPAAGRDPRGGTECECDSGDGGIEPDQETPLSRRGWPMVDATTAAALAMYGDSCRTSLPNNRYNLGGTAVVPPSGGRMLYDKLHAVWVAICDDDDAWAENHLQLCFEAAAQAPSDMVVSGLIRVEGDDTDEHRPPPPPPLTTTGPAPAPAADAAGAAAAAPRQEHHQPQQQHSTSGRGGILERPLPLPPAGPLEPSWFLRGNPGIQGSNLFLRLGVLLRAGLFDEWLPSTTDRWLRCRAGDVLLGGLAVVILENGAGDGGGGLAAAATAYVARGLQVSYFSREAQQAVCRQVLQEVAGLTKEKSCTSRDGNGRSSSGAAAVAAAGDCSSSSSSIMPPAPPPSLSLVLPLDLAEVVAAAAPGTPLPIGVTRTLLQHLVFYFVQMEVPEGVRDTAVAWILDDDKRLPRLRRPSEPRRPSPWGHGPLSLGPLAAGGPSNPVTGRARARQEQPQRQPQQGQEGERISTSVCEDRPGRRGGGAGSGGSSDAVMVGATDWAKAGEGDDIDVGFLEVLQRLRGAADPGATLPRPLPAPPDVVLGVDIGSPPLPAASCARLALLDLVTALRRQLHQQQQEDQKQRQGRDQQEDGTRCQAAAAAAPATGATAAPGTAVAVGTGTGTGDVSKMMTAVGGGGTEEALAALQTAARPPSPSSPWANEPMGPFDVLRAACAILERLYSPENLDVLMRQLVLRDQRRDADTVRRILMQTAAPPLATVSDQLDRLQVLGHGQEGVVLSGCKPGDVIFKYIFHVASRVSRGARRWGDGGGSGEERRAFLRTLPNRRPRPTACLYDIYDWVDDGPSALAVYGPYEDGGVLLSRQVRLEGTAHVRKGKISREANDCFIMGICQPPAFATCPFLAAVASITSDAGGDGAGHMCPGGLLIMLARECIAAGVVLGNVHPSNMVLLLLPSPPPPPPVPAATPPRRRRHQHAAKETEGKEEDAASADDDGSAAKRDTPPNDGCGRTAGDDREGGCGGGGGGGDGKGGKLLAVVGMIRKLYLCWRWWRREDLRELLRASLTLPSERTDSAADPPCKALAHLHHYDDDVNSVPELRGFRRFRDAVYGAYDTAEAVLLPELLRARHASEGGLAVLDYGAGSGRLLAALHGELPGEVALAGCDPGVERPRHWQPQVAVAEGRRAAVWTTDCAQAVAMQEYDVVVCSLVLCVLEDEDEYRTALKNLASALRPPPPSPPAPLRRPGRVGMPTVTAPAEAKSGGDNNVNDDGDDDGADEGGGVLILAVCNPFFTSHGSTVMQHRFPATKSGNDDISSSTGASRRGSGRGSGDGGDAGEGGGTGDGGDAGERGGTADGAGDRDGGRAGDSGGAGDGGGSGSAYRYLQRYAWTKQLTMWPRAASRKLTEDGGGGGICTATVTNAGDQLRHGGGGDFNVETSSRSRKARKVHSPGADGADGAGGSTLAASGAEGKVALAGEARPAVRRRTDVHRPLEVLLLDLRRLGLELLSVRQTASLDPDLLDEPASDFLLISLRRRVAKPTSGPATAPPSSLGHGSAPEAPLPTVMPPGPQAASGRWLRVGPTSPGPGGVAGRPRVALLIKACAMDHERIEQQVLHLTSHLADPELPFTSVVLLVDSFPGPYLRQYARPDPAALAARLETLRRLGVLDDVIWAQPAGSPENCSLTHSAEGASVTPVLQAVQQLASSEHHTTCEYALQVDCDLVVVRGAAVMCPSDAAAAANSSGSYGAGSYLRRMVEVMESDPAAVTAALDPVPTSPQPLPRPWRPSQPSGSGWSGSDGLGDDTSGGGGGSGAPAITFCGPTGPWRAEVRGCLLHLPRLLGLLPLPSLQEGMGLSPGPPAPTASGTRQDHVGAPLKDAAFATAATPNAAMRSAGQPCQGSSPPAGKAAGACGRAAAAKAVQATDADVGDGADVLPEAGALAAVSPPKWHRALDACIVASEGRIRSYRGACGGRIAVLHPPNIPIKLPSPPPWCPAWYGKYPPRQRGNMDVVGGVDDWAAALGRLEEVVVVVCGRNVAPGKFGRCLESLADQDIDPRRVGVVVVDDSSDAGACGPYMEACCRHLMPSRWRSQITFIRMHRRRRMLANIDFVVRHIVRHPDAVIVTLDADDCLLRRDALSAVYRMHFDKGHDLVIGGQLRTDRTASPAASAFGTAHVVFGGPPRQRALRGGGDVWRHLRSFRARLYNRIRTEDLLDPVTGWFREPANDWAFMVPIAEMATRPAVLPLPVYLYEPSQQECPSLERRAKREAAIGAIMALPPYCPRHGPFCSAAAEGTRGERRLGGDGGEATACPLVLGLRPLVAVVGDANLEVERVGDREEKKHLAFEVGRLLVDSGCRVLTGGEGGVMEWASKGARASARNRFVDVPMATGLGEARNATIGTAADAVIAIGGGPGTVSELCFAWMAQALAVVVLSSVQGLSAALAGRALDGRVPARRVVKDACSAAEAVELVVQTLHRAGFHVEVQNHYNNA
ncbi:hypothetical protein VOLCADRAFT_86249 [Volvox carteri f. nagariensis]|uniref:Glycosyltransferase 2-like domain-containing protein n=1 Tax=Volvox carteri f. nagariensis TaxID=3068 RepID=D8TIA3_VOLCA|nr:uncharacterized protein VOLCADRAFT_86249 [Volvox carteri f. nagariensis]EFJ52856.1 hypothetical protein VOLCADRAFT_86249 [Volvox carteri f. nagariensis]|eukprot:XP_002945861.1 hypothetical protein VOLCADRAFT_86249 [Volvox carteri f. nagariensis]